jgi:hypothetical protein
MGISSMARVRESRSLNVEALNDQAEIALFVGIRLGVNSWIGLIKYLWLGQAWVLAQSRTKVIEWNHPNGTTTQ